MKTDTTAQAARIAEQTAFPTAGYTHGMSYRQWLIGQVLAMSGIFSSAAARAEYAIVTADAVLDRLAAELAARKAPPALAGGRDAAVLDFDALENAGAD